MSCGAAVLSASMSGKSGASGSVRSLGGSVRLGTAGGHEVVLDALYEQRKRDKKSVRVLTVIVYVFCVSLAAIMLSLYYVFFWEPKDAQYAQRKVFHTVEKQTSTTPMPTCFMPLTGTSLHRHASLLFLPIRVSCKHGLVQILYEIFRIIVVLTYITMPPCERAYPELCTKFITKLITPH